MQYDGTHCSDTIDKTENNSKQLKPDLKNDFPEFKEKSESRQKAGRQYWTPPPFTSNYFWPMSLVEL
jgi:hypothetical protein